MKKQTIKTYTVSTSTSTREIQARSKKEAIELFKEAIRSYYHSEPVSVKQSNTIIMKASNLQSFKSKIMASNNITVWAAFMYQDGSDNIVDVSTDYDSLTSFCEYKESFVISEKTWEKLKTGDWFAKRYGKTIRAYQN